jgi:hypothetical protein
MGRQVRAVVAGFKDDYWNDPDSFVVATDAYVSGLVKILENHENPKGKVLCRLARAYARRFQRDLVNELVLVKHAARVALCGA